jgi:hypothetical protein
MLQDVDESIVGIVLVLRSQVHSEYAVNKGKSMFFIQEYFKPVIEFI